MRPSTLRGKSPVCLLSGIAAVLAAGEKPPEVSGLVPEPDSDEAAHRIEK
jgi:hypothetical protein